MISRNDILSALGIAPAMATISVGDKLPISEQVWLFGLTGADISWLLLLVTAIVMLVIKLQGRKGRELDLQIKQIELQIKKEKLKDLQGGE